MAYETAVVGGLVGVLFLWAYLSFNIGGDNKAEDGFQAMRVLLQLMVFLGIALALYVMFLIADVNLTSVGALMKSIFNTYMGIFTFIVLYYIVMFMIWGVRKMTEKKAGG